MILPRKIFVDFFETRCTLACRLVTEYLIMYTRHYEKLLQEFNYCPANFVQFHQYTGSVHYEVLLTSEKLYPCK